MLKVRLRRASNDTPSFEEKRHQLALTHAELNRRQDSQSRRLASIETGSSVLIASAAIVATLFASADPSPWLIAALVLSLAAAVCGVLSLFPRPIQELKMSSVRQSVLSADALSAELWLIDNKEEHILRREAVLAARFRLVQAGLCCLVGAILAVLLATIKLEIQLTAFEGIFS